MTGGTIGKCTLFLEEFESKLNDREVFIYHMIKKKIKTVKSLKLQ